MEAYGKGHSRDRGRSVRISSRLTIEHRQFTCSIAQNSHTLAHSIQHFQSLPKFILSMSCSHDGANASFSFGYGGESNSGSENPLFEQLPLTLHGETAIADDDGRNWRLASRSISPADVE